MNEKFDPTKYSFKKIGEYYKKEGQYRCEYSVKKSERVSIVYVLMVNSEIRYIGKSIRGYRRPLNYLKNKKMDVVRSGIEETIESKDVVEVFARTGLTIMFEGLELDLIEAYEQAMISRFQPSWNKHIQNK